MVIIIVITKHILYTYGMITFMSYLILRNSSWFSIIEYVWFLKHMIVFKPIGIKHLLMLCQVLKDPQDPVAALQGLPCQERQMHMEPGHWMSFWNLILTNTCVLISLCVALLSMRQCVFRSRE